MQTCIIALARGGFAAVVSFVLIAALSMNAHAQTDQASHDVSVSVVQVSVLVSRPGFVRIRAGRDQVSQNGAQVTVTDESGQLIWRTNGSNKKITAALQRDLPRFNLAIEATNETGGQAAGRVDLSSTPADLLRNIGRSDGRCDLSYEASAAMREGHGQERTSIIYTLTDQ